MVSRLHAEMLSLVPKVAGHLPYRLSRDRDQAEDLIPGDASKRLSKPGSFSSPAPI